MKQKNVVLLIVSVGIALVAAYLAANINTSKSAVTETVNVLAVASDKEIAVGSLMTEEKIKTLIVEKSIPVEDFLPEMLKDRKDLQDKRLTRSLRANDRITKKDLGASASISFPKDMNQYTLAMSAVRAVGGFVLPGAKVDIIMTEAQPNGKQKASIPLRDMLVVAVDIMDRKPEGGQVAIPTLNSVSIAVKPEEGLMLALMQKRGEISLMLRDPDSLDVKKLVPLEILPDDNNKGAGGGSTLPDVPLVKRVDIVVAKTDIPMGTLIQDDKVDELFRMMSVEEPAPPGALMSTSGLKGKYLTQPLFTQQFLTEGSYSNEDPKKLVVPEKPQVAEVPTLKPRPMTHAITIQNGQAVRVSVFEKNKSGEFKMTDKVQAPDPDQDLEPAPSPRPNPNGKPPANKSNAL